MTVIFDGKSFAQKKKKTLGEKVISLKKRGINPCLASIYLANDPGSVLYTRLKKKASEDIGVRFLSFENRQKDLEKIISKIEKLNEDPEVGGILVQKPSGERDFNVDDWNRIISSISPRKDIDGLTPKNLGLLLTRGKGFIPAAAKAVMEVLKEWQIDLTGKSVVIIGASEILGKPLSILLTDKKATVSILHKSSGDIGVYTKKADLVITATGCQGLLKSEMLKPGSALIDLGAPQGDVDKRGILKKVSFFSPVPGGVGPVTVCCLLENLLESLEVS